MAAPALGEGGSWRTARRFTHADLPGNRVGNSRPYQRKIWSWKNSRPGNRFSEESSVFTQTGSWDNGRCKKKINKKILCSHMVNELKPASWHLQIELLIRTPWREAGSDCPNMRCGVFFHYPWCECDIKPLLCESQPPKCCNHSSSSSHRESSMLHRDVPMGRVIDNEWRVKTNSLAHMLEFKKKKKKSCWNTAQGW